MMWFAFFSNTDRLGLLSLIAVRDCRPGTGNSREMRRSVGESNRLDDPSAARRGDGTVPKHCTEGLRGLVLAEAI